MGTVTLLSQLRDVPARLRNESRQVPTRDIDETEVEVESTPHAAAGVTAVAVAMRRAIGQMGVRRTAATLPRLNQVDGFDCQGCAWPDPDAGPPARRRVLRERRQGGRRGGDPPAARPRVLRHPLRRGPRRAHRVLAGQAGPAHRADGPAPGRHPLRRRSRGTTPSRPSPATCAASTTPTRRSSTPRARPPTRPRSSTSSSCGPSAPTTCPTAPTCATSRPARPSSRPSASARARSASRTSTRPSCSWSSGRTRAPTTRGCSPRSRRPSATARRSSRSTRSRRPGWSASRTRRRPRGIGRGHRAGRPAPADPAQRRPGALPGDRRAAARVGRDRPRLHRRVHHRLRRVRRARRRPRLGQGRGGDRPHPRAGHRGGPDVRRLAGDDHLLGDGHHPAPQLGGHDQGDRQRRPAAGQHRQAGRRACARCAATPTSRATGRWASGSGCPTTSSTRSATSSASTRPASTATTRSDSIRALRDGKVAGLLGRWAATSWPPPPTPRPPRRRCATPR